MTDADRSILTVLLERIRENDLERVEYAQLAEAALRILEQDQPTHGKACGVHAGVGCDCGVWGPIEHWRGWAPELRRLVIDKLRTVRSSVPAHYYKSAASVLEFLGGTE